METRSGLCSDKDKTVQWEFERKEVMDIGPGGHIIKSTGKCNEISCDFWGDPNKCSLDSFFNRVYTSIKKE